MSLINDALKRAKIAQLQTPPSSLPALQLRPIEPAQEARHGPRLLLPVVVSVVALCGLLLLWCLSPGNQAPKLVHATTQAPPAPTADSPPPPAPPAVESPSAAVAQGSESSPPPAGPTPQPTAPAIASPSASPATTVSAPSASPPTLDPPLTNPPATAAPPLPSPTPLKLQAIVFNPDNPSAMINGKPLFIGERIGEFRVVAIGRDSATLVSAGQTNVLTLP